MKVLKYIWRTQNFLLRQTQLKEMITFLRNMVKTFWGLLLKAKKYLNQVYWRISHWKSKPTYRTLRQIPILVFSEINKTGNLELLGNVIQPEKVWFSIYNEYIENFDLPKEYMDYLNTIKRWSAAQVAVMDDPNTMNQAILAIRESELENFYNQKESARIETNLALIEKMWGGMKLDYSKVSAFEYYNYLKTLKHGENNT